MNMSRQQLGRLGERKAAQALQTKGYEIIAHSYRSRFGEIDLIVKKNCIVAFVEVKLRKDAAFMNAFEAVTASKMEKIKATALQWIAENPGDRQYRFDIVEVYTSTGVIHIHENAFS